MTLAGRIRHLLGKDDHEKPARIDIDAFIAERQAAVDRIDPAELERVTEEALQNVDRDEFIRESAIAREQWKQELRARRSSQ